MTLLLFTLALFVSAGLLFLVQPMTARMVLPLLGGTPAVWNSCMLFYQSALLAGYAYAHAASTRLPGRRGLPVHALVLLLPLLVLPLELRGGEPPAGGSPVAWLLLTLAASVGLPFFALATTAPLVQRWFARSGHEAAGDPYFLYVASNAGSLAGLAGYLLFVEPRFTLAQQGRLWSAGYLLFLVLAAACAATSARSGPPAGESPAPDPAGPAPPLPRRMIGRWLLLSFTPASLMLGLTAYISTDMAAVPLFWVLPLGLYLLSYMAAFAREPRPPVHFYQRALPILALGQAVVLARSMLPLPWMLLMHLAVFFCAAVACHGQLAAERPGPQHLTTFYLVLAAGGALGGLFNALLAPLIFRSVVEYPLALVLACGLCPLRRGRAPGPGERRSDPRRPLLRSLLFSGCLLALTWGLLAAMQRADRLDHRLEMTLLLGFLALVCYTAADRPPRMALAMGAVLLGLGQFPVTSGHVRHQERNFFGVLRVIDRPNGRDRELHHGTTLHGVQDSTRLGEPGSYYSRGGPLGDVMEWAESRRRGGSSPLSVAVIGLGTGTIAAYARPGDRFTYYEIDPAVAQIAARPRWFTYLRDARERGADVRIVLGDARLSIRSAPAGAYDLIVLDAFSSDSVPTHLLSTQALALYLEKLAPGGIIAYHVSSRCLELRPVIAALGRAARLAVLECTDRGLVNIPPGYGRSASQWVVVARSPGDFGPLAKNPRWKSGPFPPIRPWTDDYADVPSAIVWR